MSRTLRATAVMAFVVGFLLLWVVYRSVERAQDSSQWVVHTQEVLTAIETVLSTLVDAEGAARSYMASAENRKPEPIDQAERSLEGDVNRLATLTADNPNQQARISKLRQEATQTLAALRAQWGAKRGERVASAVDADT